MHKGSVLSAVLVFAAALVAAEDVASQCQDVSGTIYENSLETLYGSNVDLSQFVGQVSVVMNHGVYNDLTWDMMTGMNALLERYESSGVVGFGFPCTQFNLEQPGYPAEILNAYKYLRPGNGWVPHKNFNLFTTVEVNGDGASDIFKFLKSGCPAYRENIGSKDSFYWDDLVARDITGNYEKFLVDINGKPRYRFAPEVAMESIYPFIDDLLKEVPVVIPENPGVVS